jgi:type IX secretion system PorP/SprF family membrane protein
MKKYLIAVVLVVIVLGAQAQSRKDIANFSLFQQYYNPSLTGFEGSIVKTLYRSQWVGFENAPKTMFVSGEIDMADYRAKALGNVRKSVGYLTRNAQQSANQAIGISVLHDTFGPFVETQLHLNYGSAIWLNKKLSIRWGGTLSFNSHGLDGNRLTLDQERDPEFEDVIGKMNRAHKADINLGVALAGDNFYAGYAMQNITKGKLLTSGDEYFDDSFSQQHIVQAGYRVGVADDFAIVANAMYRYDKTWKGTAEGQLKGVFRNLLWMGAGYRYDLTYNMGGGILLDRLKIAYVYEVPTDEGWNLNQLTNEVLISYNLVPFKYKKNLTPVFMW